MTGSAPVPAFDSLEKRLRRKYPDDALERLARSEQEYYSTHGDYVPELASLLLIERAEINLLRERLRHVYEQWGDDIKVSEGGNS